MEHWLYSGGLVAVCLFCDGDSSWGGGVVALISPLVRVVSGGFSGFFVSGVVARLSEPEVLGVLGSGAQSWIYYDLF